MALTDLVDIEKKTEAEIDNLLAVSHSNSLYINRGVSIFYGTEIETWAGFGP